MNIIRRRLLAGALLVAVGLGVRPLAAMTLGKLGAGMMGQLGAAGGSRVKPPTGKILLVDGVSFILQTNGASKICRAGGC